MKTLKLSAAASLLLLLGSCSNTTGDIGASLIQEEAKVVIHNEFTLSGRTVANTRIQSRTIVELLGSIQADGYGAFSSDFACQFLPAQKLVTDGVPVENIDSLHLVLAYPNGAYVGDSIAPMGLQVYQIKSKLESPIYSNSNPLDYYDPQSQPIASKIYVGNAQGESDSIQALSYREIAVKLPLSLARKLYQEYLDNPATYQLPTSFAKFFPGLYVHTSFGAGRVTQIQRTTMVMYYHTDGTDTDGKTVPVRHSATYYAVTPEVVTNNFINYTIDPKLEARINAGENIIVAPVGRDVELNFPLQEVIDYYIDNSGLLSVVNTLTMEIPAVKLDSDYGIEPPQSLLMVLSSKKDEFFKNNSLPDNETSFIATYSAANNSYTFSGLRAYFQKMFDKYKAEGTIDPAEMTFTLTPVAVSTESSGSYYNTTEYISAVNPYIGKPAMVKLNLDKADITFQFAKQNFK